MCRTCWSAAHPASSRGDVTWRIQLRPSLRGIFCSAFWICTAFIKTALVIATAGWQDWYNMRVRYVAIICAVSLVFAVTATGAVTSPVADAAMRGDQTALKSLLQQKA